MGKRPGFVQEPRYVVGGERPEHVRLAQNPLGERLAATQRDDGVLGQVPKLDLIIRRDPQPLLLGAPVQEDAVVPVHAVLVLVEEDQALRQLDIGRSRNARRRSGAPRTGASSPVRYDSP